MTAKSAISMESEPDRPYRDWRVRDYRKAIRPHLENPRESSTRTFVKMELLELCDILTDEEIGYASRKQALHTVLSEIGHNSDERLYGSDILLKDELREIYERLEDMDTTDK